MTKDASVPLPARSGLGLIGVTDIDATNVDMVVTLTGSDFASDGGCAPTITGPAAGSSGWVMLSCTAGARSVVNGVSIEVLGIAAGAAVLRVQPVPSAT